MKIDSSQITLHNIFSGKSIATVYLISLCVCYFAEGAISPLKVTLMALAPLLFIFKVPYFSKAFVWGMAYWGMCYVSALINGDMRFSTIGYLGMFIITYIVFYNLLYKGAFTFNYFYKLLRWLIIAYGITLILQQICILIGIRSFFLINLDNQFFLSITKLPSLSLEPSHSARILTVLMLGYLRCTEIDNDGVRPTLSLLFNRENRLVTCLFLWTMLTMGSGTAFIGLGILSFYFIQKRTLVYVIPIFCGLFYVGNSLELEQMERAVKITQVVTNGGSVKDVQNTDGSAAVRIIPLINTFTKTDLTQRDTWLGKGTAKKDSKWYTHIADSKLGTIDQYGMIAYIISLIFVYTCMIRRFFSIENVIFFFLLGLSIGNIYYTWGCMIIFSAVRYFQVQDEKGLLEINDEENDDNE